MSHHGRVTFAALIMVLSPHLATSQLPAGTRIRVTAAPTVNDGIGVVVSHSADTLVLREETGGLIAVPTSQLTRLDRSGGLETSMLRKSAYGTVGGAAVGAVIGFLTYRLPPACVAGVQCHDLGSGIPAMFGAAIGGASGLVVGALFGMRETERWNPVRASGVDGFRVGQARDRGITFSASRSF